MKSWKRITLVVFVLIGGTMYFSYWYINQFNIALDNISAPYFANIHSAYPSFKQDTGLASTSSEIEISPEISGEFVMSTDSELASASPEISVTPVTSTDPKLSFTSPQKDTKVYIGCTYPISWQSSMMINSLEAALIDAGARETIEPKTSGLAKENTIEKESQNLNWKVGFSVWPGAYYIKVSKINGVEAEFRSKTFQIGKLPEGINEEEKINICRESSG